MNLFSAATYNAILGQAVGDAWGASIECHPKAPALGQLSLDEGRYLTHVDTGARPALARLPGLYTDDTQRALALLRARALCGDDVEAAAAFLYGDLAGMLRMKVSGSTQGVHRGTGGNFREAIRTKAPVNTAGVGAAMGVAPVATTWGNDPGSGADMVRWVVSTAGVTTNNPVSLAGAGFFALVAWGSAHGCLSPGKDFLSMWETAMSAEESIGLHHAFRQMVRAYLILCEDGVPKLLEWATETGLSNKPLNEPANGFALTTVPWAARAGLHATSFEDALIRVTTSKGDVDTVAAMAGSLATIRLGTDSIPAWMLLDLVGSAHIKEPERWQPLGSERPLTQREVALQESLLRKG